MKTEQYFEAIEKSVKKSFECAREAKVKGIDPVAEIEVPIATSLAEKAVGLISTMYPQLNDKKIVDKITELEEEFGPLTMSVALGIAESIAREKYCKFESLLQAIDAGIRVGFSYMTLGVVSSPLEGFTELKLGKTKNGEEYFRAYFSGPIRSAGTTASCVVLMIIDYLRETFGFAKYDPTDEEVRRYVTENYDYHERITNLQYLPTEEEIVFLAKHIPIEVTGEPSEEREVSNYKDLPRIETNFIRGGMCLIFSEGLAQKAQKGLRLLRGAQEKGFKATGWEFLDDYVKIHKKREKGSADSSPTYIKDLVAGRPVFSHPSRSGGFRFRYGRTRMSGFSAEAIHPATMGITDGFLAIGTQLKIEKPTKGCALGVCDEIDGPIVKLKNGSVRRLYDYEEARKIYSEVEEIIYLGDLLFAFGDVANRNYELLKPGYVEEWWEMELRKAEEKLGEKERIKIDKRDVEIDSAIELSRKFGIPMHPNYIYFWREISYEQFLGLLDWLAHGRVSEKKLILPYSLQDKERFAKGKRALELIGCEHQVTLENIVLGETSSRAFLMNLGIEVGTLNLEKDVDKIIEVISERSVLDLINLLSSFKIKDKSGTFIGARMGRPEKAKLRKLKGSPHAIFPVGKEGGRLRSFQEAMAAGVVTAEFPVYYCGTCNKETIYPRCEICEERCSRLNYCLDCDENYQGNCLEHPTMRDFKEKRIDVAHYFNSALKKLKMRREEIPQVIKGIKGTSSKGHACENLAKGLLRAKHNLNVNKDGTIRYDMTEMVITHFKPKEIGVSVEKLKTLGYEIDSFGGKLENEEQVLTLFPHDIILPSCPESMDERADDTFLRVSKFIDDELEKVYGIEKFYNAQKKDDLIGHLFVCIAPHICTATVGRVIGFSKTQAFLASPYMHAAMRRDCDGDESAVMMLMDLLLNFSRKFLPSHRGGTQDAPLVLNTQIRAGDVDDQILDFELCGQYPLELYEMAEQGKHSSDVKFIDNVRRRLKEGTDPFTNISYSHGCKDINKCALSSSYKTLPTMHDKVAAQMKLCGKIRAIDLRDVSRLIIERHFIRDIRGNLRKFSQQEFRCVNCNSKYRRPPLAGKCTNCGGKIIFTISHGSIVKYMQPALDLANNYQATPYLLESLKLTEMFIESIFGKDAEKQESLKKWF